MLSVVFSLLTRRVPFVRFVRLITSDRTLAKRNQITINDLPVGRSVDETLRLIDAFQFTEKVSHIIPHQNSIFS